MTPFSFEHTFSAPSPAAVIAAYFDADHQVEQDRANDILERTVLELVDTPSELRRVCRVVSRRQLPAVLRPFSSGPLHYVETVTWRRDRHELAIAIQLMKRTRIEATYQLENLGPGSVRRRYFGRVSVDVALLASRVEAGIVTEFSRSMPVAAACTQAWLDRQQSSARA